MSASNWITRFTSLAQAANLTSDKKKAYQAALLTITDVSKRLEVLRGDPNEVFQRIENIISECVRACVPCRAVPCRAVPCRAALCRAVPSRAMLGSIMQCNLQLG